MHFLPNLGESIIGQETKKQKFINGLLNVVEINGPFLQSLFANSKCLKPIITRKPVPGHPKLIRTQEENEWQACTGLPDFESYSVKFHDILLSERNKPVEDNEENVIPEDNCEDDNQEVEEVNEAQVEEGNERNCKSKKSQKSIYSRISEFISDRSN